MRAVAPELIRLPDGGGPVREVFITLPGLNFHPDRLEPWEARFAVAGAATVRPALKGYLSPDDPAWRDVSAAAWLDDVSECYLRIAQRFVGAKISLFGYSLGGVLGLVWSRQTHTPLHRAVLLAPALASKPLPRVALQLATWLPGRMLVKSWAPRSYRLHRDTSLGAYQAVRALMGMFKRGTGEEPGALFAAVSGKDELVSPQVIDRYQAALAKTHPAGVVRMHWLEHQPRPGWMHHLGVDAFTLGETPWQRLAADLDDWLAATAP
ncbi:MAG TPA: alpha/beta hydrolase [bacterium]